MFDHEERTKRARRAKLGPSSVLPPYPDEIGWATRPLMCPLTTTAPPVIPDAPLVAPPVAGTSGAAAAVAPTVGGVKVTTVQVTDGNVTFNLEVPVVPAPMGLSKPKYRKILPKPAVPSSAGLSDDVGDIQDLLELMPGGEALLTEMDQETRGLLDDILEANEPISGRHRLPRPVLTSVDPLNVTKKGRLYPGKPRGRNTSDVNEVEAKAYKKMKNIVESEISVGDLRGALMSIINETESKNM